MNKENKFDYYYGKEAEQFAFYRIPKLLITDERFKGVSNDAKLLYGLMLDRMSLSIRNSWFDEQNRAYIHYTVENVKEDLGCAGEKCSKLFKELQGVGLIEKVRQGLGKPDIIYVKNFMTDAYEKSKVEVKETVSEDLEKAAEMNEEPSELQDIRKSNYLKFDDSQERNSKIEYQEDIPVSEIRKSNVRDSIMPLSRNSEIESLEVRESKGNKTNNNNTESNKTNLINQSIVEDDGLDVMDGIHAYMALIKVNIGYESLLCDADYSTTEMVNEIYNTICDVVCVNKKSIKISGEEYPYELVKSRFLKIKKEHVEYVIDKITNYTGTISNIKAYLLTALYNAPTTFNLNLSQEVKHDMFGGGWIEKGVI